MIIELKIELGNRVQIQPSVMSMHQLVRSAGEVRKELISGSMSNNLGYTNSWFMKCHVFEIIVMV